MTYSIYTHSQFDISGALQQSASGYISLIYNTEHLQMTESIYPMLSQTSLSTRKVPNYKNAYEYISIGGRTENNLYTRDFPISSTTSPMSVITGQTIFSLPERTRNKSVIVTRFSAPGDKTTLSRGYLDIHAEEFSVYNGINNRNLIARKDLSDDLTTHFDLGNTGSYTLNKSPRNTKYTIKSSTLSGFETKSLFDNGNIGYQIPYHPDQIQWVYRVYAKTSSSWANNFLINNKFTASDYYLTESVFNSSSLTASFVNDYHSAYGFPSWIQVRAGQNWKTRLLKSKNYIIKYQPDINEDNRAAIVQPSFLTGNEQLDEQTLEDAKYIFKESNIDFTNEKIEYHFDNGLKLEEAVFKTKFLNSELNNIAGLDYIQTNNLKIKLNNLGNYKKVIKKQLYPAAKYAGLKRYKVRENFIFDAWRDDPYLSESNGYRFHLLQSRDVTGSNIPRGYTIPALSERMYTGSIWPLDFYSSSVQRDRNVAGELMWLGSNISLQTRVTNTPIISYHSNGGFGQYTCSLPWTTPIGANSKPFQDNNEVFSLLTKRQYKEYAFIPEWRVSSLIDSLNFSDIENSLVTASLSPELTGTSRLEVQFTDQFKIKNNLKFDINSILLMRPYKNFYPVQITMECGRLLSQSLSSFDYFHQYIDGTYAYNNMVQIMATYFGGGIMYNSIKAGIASQFYTSLSNNDANVVAPFESIFDPFSFFRNKEFLSGGAPFTQTVNSVAYRILVKNFLEEVRHTFCKNSALDYFSSKDENAFDVFESGTTYSMDLKLNIGKVAKNNNSNFNWTDGVNFIGKKPFGVLQNIPPWYQSPDPGNIEYNGISTCRLSFTPDYTRKYTIDEIISNTELDFRINKELTCSFASKAYCQKVTSSFDIFNKELDECGNYVWKIKSKWEFPFLALTGTIFTYSVGNFRYNDSLSRDNTKAFIGGLWHDYCEIPSENQGLFLELSDVKYSGSVFFESASLATKVGFQQDNKRVGELNDYKNISELLCLIPIYKDNNSYVIIDDTFSIFNENMEHAKKYMLPPKLGYNNLNERPKLFFGIEIRDVWSKKDLSYIWQNVLPQNGLTHKEINNIYEVKCPKALELLKDKNIYFMVFKCKLRSVSNPYPSYSYNWPWDYFSLQELCKIDIITEDMENE